MEFVVVTKDNDPDYMYRLNHRIMNHNPLSSGRPMHITLISQDVLTRSLDPGVGPHIAMYRSVYTQDEGYQGRYRLLYKLSHPTEFSIVHLNKDGAMANLHEDTDEFELLRQMTDKNKFLHIYDKLTEEKAIADYKADDRLTLMSDLMEYVVSAPSEGIQKLRAHLDALREV